MDEKFADKIRDCVFVEGKEIGAAKDSILLRMPVVRDGVRADAIVRLDVQCYVHPTDGSNLIDILVDSFTAPRTLDDVRQGWRVDG